MAIVIGVLLVLPFSMGKPAQATPTPLRLGSKLLSLAAPPASGRGEVLLTPLPLAGGAGGGPISERLIAREQAQPAPSETELSARAILETAVAAAGGDTWLNPRSLILTGDATFYSPDSAAPRSTATSYRMWRIYNPDRTVAHAADGMVRIAAHDGTRRLFEVGFDGSTTWNERGVVPPAEAEAYWASNFGFGIVRQALRDGFTITRVPDSEVGGHPLYMIRITSPDGGSTLFGIDQRSRFIRLMGFVTPRGYHVRVYDRFYWAANMPTGTRWLQPGEITLTYNGVVQNVIRWTAVQVNPDIPAVAFRNPADGGIATP